jgi:ClpP class serine protease
MITETYLDKVLEILRERNNGITELAVSETLSPKNRSIQYFADQSLGVVDIHGAITDIPYYGMCGEKGVSHQSIREEVTQLIEAGAKTIVLDQDSHGGAAHMAFESANYIRNLADDNDVKLIAYVSGNSFSASYVYTAVAHEVIVNPTAETGSVGVRVQLRNMNGYMKRLGIEDVYITAGEGKVPFDSEGNFEQSFLDDIKESVLEMYDQFVDHVTMWRGMTPAQVRAMGAKTYSSKRSLDNGLIDSVMTLQEFKNYITNEQVTMTNPITNLFNKSKTTKETQEMSLDKERLEAYGAELTATLKAEFASELKVELTKAKEQFEAQYAAREQELSAELSAVKEALAEVEKQKAEAKQAARIKELSVSLGDEKAAKLAATLSELDDAKFAEAVEVFTSAKKDKDAEFLAEHGDLGDEVEAPSLDNKEARAKAYAESFKKL